MNSIPIAHAVSLVLCACPGGLYISWGDHVLCARPAPFACELATS